MFREFSMESVNGYNKLSNTQKALFDTTYKKHLSSMSMEERIHYSEYNVVKIEPGNNVVKVYFNIGNCFIYSPDYTWLKLS